MPGNSGDLGGVDDYTRKQEDAILKAITNGDRLRAMKLYRELYGASIKEAKEFVDDVGKK
jgi:ribosomal protein L7/L12